MKIAEFNFDGERWLPCNREAVAATACISKAFVRDMKDFKGMQRYGFFAVDMKTGEAFFPVDVKA